MSSIGTKTIEAKDVRSGMVMSDGEVVARVHVDYVTERVTIHYEGDGEAYSHTLGHKLDIQLAADGF